MLIRLTRAMRWRAAGTLGLLYMLCVLAPAVAFAFGDGSRAAHCVTDDHHGLRTVHVHEHVGHEHAAHKHDGRTVHVHDDGTSHEHSKAPDGKSPDAQCCGLVCLSALPAGVVDVATPIFRAVAANSARQNAIAGKPPDRLYRPPISSLSL
jgi:hypothetical protein